MVDAGMRGDSRVCFTKYFSVGERLTPTLCPLTHEIPGLVPRKAGL